MSFKRRIGKMYKTRERLYDEYFYGLGKISDHKLKNIRRRLNKHTIKNKRVMKHIVSIMLRKATLTLKNNPEMGRLCEAIINKNSGS